MEIGVHVSPEGVVLGMVVIWGVLDLAVRRRDVALSDIAFGSDPSLSCPSMVNALHINPDRKSPAISKVTISITPDIALSM